MSNDFPFELASFVRPTDPATSKQAAESRDNRLRWGSQRHKLLVEFYVAGAAGLTDEEAGKASGLYQSRACFWKRCGELRDLGFIADTGVTRKSSCNHDVGVCVITQSGLVALSEAKEVRP